MRHPDLDPLDPRALFADLKPRPVRSPGALFDAVDLEAIRRRGERRSREAGVNLNAKGRGRCAVLFAIETPGGIVPVIGVVEREA